MSDCANIMKELNSYIDGDVNNRIKFKIETHLKTCSVCKQEELALKDCIQLTKEVSPSVFIDVRHSLNRIKFSKINYRNNFQPLVAIIFLSIILAFVMQSIIYRTNLVNYNFVSQSTTSPKNEHKKLLKIDLPIQNQDEFIMDQIGIDTNKDGFYALKF